jgi:hypothetical protein
MKNEQQIRWIGGNKSRLVTIENWQFYQGNNESLPPKTEQQTEQQLNTNKNDKNVKNEKNIKNSYDPRFS